MSKKQFHIVTSKTKNGWSVKSGGKTLSSHQTQVNANKSAIKKAKKVGGEVLIHGKDGKIRDKNSYGNHPFPPRG